MQRLAHPLVLVLALAGLARAAPASRPPATPIAPVFGAIRDLTGRVAQGLGLDARTTFTEEQRFDAPGGGHIVRLQQRFAGVPVRNAVLAVRLDAAGNVLHVESSAVRLADVETTPKLPAAEAMAIARTAVRVPITLDPRGSALLVVARAHGGRLAWDVFVQPALPLWSPHVLVDAQTGDVLGTRDEAKHAANARVFADGASAKAARKADGTFDLTKLSDITLDSVGTVAAGTNLVGPDILGYNCCANEGCDTSKPAKQLKIKLPISGTITVNADLAVCDELPVAAADANGDFKFDPAQEPTKDCDSTTGANCVPAPSEQGDAFSEVMGYHFADQTLAWVQTLDPAFELRTQGRPLRVTTNFTLPDFRQAIANFDFATFSTSTANLIRFDNSAFIPSGSSLVGVPIPELQRDFDSLVLFQGTRSDFAYDADVISHEFGHAVIETSGGLAGDNADEWGVVPEAGAMNEGLADYIAAARTNDPKIGEYVGDLTGAGEGALRNLANDLKCPSMIRGEVHNDSQHFSASLWAARTILGTDAATRLTFDKAMLAAIRGLTPTATFENAGIVFATEVGTAFPTNGKSVMGKEFADRGVTGCDRVVPLDDKTALTGYEIVPANHDEGFGNFAPGPVQFELTAPAGANLLTIHVSGSASLGGLGVQLPGGLGGQTGPQLKGLLKDAQPIVFTYAGGDATADAGNLKPFLQDVPDADKTPTVKTAFQLDGACGGKTFYLALENLSQDGAWAMKKVSAVWTTDPVKVAACAPPDAGTPVVDAGTAGSGGDVPKKSGCGCDSTGPVFALALGGLLLAMRRRVRA